MLLLELCFKIIQLFTSIWKKTHKGERKHSCSNLKLVDILKEKNFCATSCNVLKTLVPGTAGSCYSNKNISIALPFMVVENMNIILMSETRQNLPHYYFQQLVIWGRGLRRERRKSTGPHKTACTKPGQISDRKLSLVTTRLTAQSQPQKLKFCQETCTQGKSCWSCCWH